MKRTPLKRKTPLRKTSRRRQQEHKEYEKLKKQFLASHPLCQVWLEVNGLSLDCPAATEIHHRCCGKNRKATYLRTDTWMAVSRWGHNYIHNDPKLAYGRGWLLKTIPDKPNM